MKFRLFIISAICLFSCSAPTQEKTEIVKEEVKVLDSKPVLNKVEELQTDTLEKRRLECEAYWKNVAELYERKHQYLDEILAKNKLSENNLRFLTALRKEKEDGLGFEKAVSAVFRFSKTEIGITISPKFSQDSNRYIVVNKENDLFPKYDTTVNVKGTIDKLRLYPNVFTSMLSGKEFPAMHYYTTKRRGTTKIVGFGTFGDECSDYYQYSLDTKDISINDKVLISSPFVIDLEFGNYPKIDVLLQNSHKEECMDCPSSGKFEKTFAKVKGTDNLYFVYADTFPINNTLDTPSRALALINEKNEVLYFWYDEIDLFGCSCL